MDSCSLANTGISNGVVLMLGLLMIALSLLAIAVKKQRTTRSFTCMGVLIVLAVQILPLFTMTTMAAPVMCAANPDTSTGAQGQVQAYSVITNDTPTPGYGWVLGSLTLALVDNSRPGSVLSADSKTVTVPVEGVYQAKDGGIIEYTPEPQFAGQTFGVRYSITDTSGRAYTSTYTPTVQSNVSATVCPEGDRMPVPRSNSMLNVFLNADANGYPVDGQSTVLVGLVDQSLSYGDGSSLDGVTSGELRQSVDIDVLTPGIQTTVDKSNEEGWILQYDASSDSLILTVTNSALLYARLTQGLLLLQYSINDPAYCLTYTGTLVIMAPDVVAGN